MAVSYLPPVFKIKGLEHAVASCHKPIPINKIQIYTVDINLLVSCFLN